MQLRGQDKSLDKMEVAIKKGKNNNKIRSSSLQTNIVKKDYIYTYI